MLVNIDKNELGIYREMLRFKNVGTLTKGS